MAYKVMSFWLDRPTKGDPIAWVTENFQLQINIEMQAGWRPIGGIAVALNGIPGHGDVVLMQSMVRLKELGG